MALAQGLRARLRKTHRHLQSLGRLDVASAPEQPWWSSVEGDAQCWWITAATRPSPQETQQRESAEALALLRALAQIDDRACMEEIHEVWPDQLSEPTPETASLLLGLSYTISTCDQFAPVSERVFGADPPNPGFLWDYAWLHDKLKATGRSLWVNTIPVRLHVTLSSEDPDELARTLRQILHSVTTQQLLAQQTLTDTEAKATRSARFEIVEVRFHERERTTLTMEALVYLGQLTQLGVRVPVLPAIYFSMDRINDQDFYIRAKALQMLIPPHRDGGAKHVCVSDYMCEDCEAALFVALQHSQGVRSVEFDMQRDEPGVGAESLWRWLAYALFSKDARHRIESVTLWVNRLDQECVDIIASVVQADDPLERMYWTRPERNLWVTASTFHVDDPSNSTRDDYAPMVIQTPIPLTVRVIDKNHEDDATRYMVYMPGSSEVFVRCEDVITEAVEGSASYERHSPAHFRLEGLEPASRHNVISLLRLVAHDANSIEVELLDASEEDHDWTYWVTAVLSVCPNVERLGLPSRAMISSFCTISDAGEGNHCPLRFLSIPYTVDVATSDILDFLNGLCDESSSTTRYLEDLSISVSVPTDWTKAFHDKWQRMLQCNRVLHTISLKLHATNSVDDEANNPVAIRTGPLSITGKLAFLSVTEEPNRESAVSRLDTSVVGTIFRFAAEHRVRVVKVEQEML